MGQKKSTVIGYDYNGCILDDFIVAHTSMNRILMANNREQVTEAEYRTKFDMPLLKLYSNFGFEGYPEGGQQIYAEVVKELDGQVKIRDNVGELLTNAKVQGVRNVLISNSPTAVIMQKLKENELDLMFDEIIGLDHPKYGVSKNKSDNFAAYLAENPADEVVTIGDTFEEIDMADRFKGTSVVITGGYTSEERLRDRAPHFVVNNFNEFGRILMFKGIFKREVA